MSTQLNPVLPSTCSIVASDRFLWVQAPYDPFLVIEEQALGISFIIKKVIELSIEGYNFRKGISPSQSASKKIPPRQKNFVQFLNWPVEENLIQIENLPQLFRLKSK